MRASVLVLCAFVGTASADDDEPPKPPRAVHGSVGFGGSILLTGMAGGSRLRVDGEVDLEPGGRFGRFGGLLAIRAADKDHHGLACLGLVYEAAASRPRLVLDLHVDAGADLDARKPLVGGGLRTTLTLIGPLAIAFDGGAHLVIDGIDGTRLVIANSTSLVARW